MTNTMYKTIYVIRDNKVVKGELAKVFVKIDDNPYHNIEMEAPNIEVFEEEEDAKKELREKLELQKKRIDEELETL